MKLFFHFRHTKVSQAIQDHLSDRVDRLQKFEMKPVTCDVTLKMEGTVHTVEMHATGNGPAMRATGQGDDYFEAADEALNKMVRQMEKKKSKTKNHRCFERSHLGKLDQLTEEMGPNEALEADDMQDAA